jgi:hypothetical protein
VLVPQAVYLAVYKNFMEAIDAIDNGVNQWDSDAPPKYVNNTHLSARVGRLNPDWNEDSSGGRVLGAGAGVRRAWQALGLACWARAHRWPAGQGRSKRGGHRDALRGATPWSGAAMPCATCACKEGMVTREDGRAAAAATTLLRHGRRSEVTPRRPAPAEEATMRSFLLAVELTGREFLEAVQYYAKVPYRCNASRIRRSMFCAAGPPLPLPPPGNTRPLPWLLSCRRPASPLERAVVAACADAREGGVGGAAGGAPLR